MDVQSTILFVLSLCLHTVNSQWNWFFRRNTCSHLIDYVISPVSPNCYNNPDVKSDMVTMITRNKYKAEMHPVVTSDGYILKLFRIPAKGKQPIYLLHGATTNGHPYVDKKNRSLAFHLAKRGFDVWIGTVRGSTYGKNHLNLSKNDKLFWDFNLDDHVEKDLPETLGYVANVTGKAGEIIYIGYSMGTTVSFMFASSQPEKAQQLLKGVIALSPVAYIDKNVLIKALSPFSGVIRSLLKLYGIRVLFKDEKGIESLLILVCRHIPHVCVNIISLVAGKDPKQFSPKDLLLFFSSWPGPVVVDKFIQYLQIADKERFQKFDYGGKNKEIYGQDVPPAYDLSKTTVPMYLFYGKNDAISPAENLQRLFAELGSKKKQLIQISEDEKVPFNHVSFEYAKDAETLLYPPLFEALDKLA